MFRPPLIDVRCPNCSKLLFRATPGGSIIEVKCDRCKVIVRWPGGTGEVVVSDKPRPSENKGED